jgi:hypothetical protein
LSIKQAQPAYLVVVFLVASEDVGEGRATCC